MTIIIASIVWTGALVASVAVTSAIAAAVATFLFLRKNKNKAAVLDSTVTSLRKS